MLVKQEVKARSVYEPCSESLVTMETKFGERPNADASILSPESEAVANELQELSLQPAPNLLPVRERKNKDHKEPVVNSSSEQVLQLKLQQRRSREELVKQGIMPPLKSSAAFHEQRRSLERARTEDYLKRKIKSRPERSELIRMHILEETSAGSSLQAKQLQLKRARLADDLNDKISHRPGPMELIHKNILPVHSSIKQAIIKTQFPRASGENSSCDEDSSCSLSPDQPVSQQSPLGLLPLSSPPETLTGSSIPSPTQVPPPVHPLQPMSGSSPSLNLTNEMAAPSAQRTAAISQIKYQPKPHSAQKHKKSKDNKPKIKKLKYHQYIPPDQKGDKEPPPHLDSSYAKILQQQQLFLQLQILNQQQQHYNYHAILPAPPKPQIDQQPSSSSSSNSTAASSPPRPVTAPSAAPSNQESQSCQSSAPLGGTKPVSLPPNLDEMKVAELKAELKLRSLPVSGTKNDLIERLRTYQDLNGGSDTSFSPTAGGTTGPGAEGAEKSSKTAATTSNSNTSQQQKPFHCHQTSSVCAQTAHTDRSATPAAPPPQQLITCGGSVSHPGVPLTPSDCSQGAMSPEETNSNNHLQKMMNSPLTQLNLQPCSAAQLPVNVKEEPKCCSPETCQFSLKTTSVQRHRPISSTAPITATTASGATMDKDKMLREKDKQIEELTRMLRQKQRLVEVLKMQLERGRSEGRVPEPLVLVRVKQEPPDKPSTPVSLSPTTTSVTCEMDASKVCVKQEAMEAGEVESETTAQLQDTHGLLQSSTKTQEAQIKSDQMSTQTKQQKHICLQQTALQFAQQQAIQKLLLQQQQNIQNQQQMIQNRGQTLQNQQNLQKLSQQRKRKPNKQQLKQQQQLLQHQQATQHQQQIQPKQQTLLKQQNRQQQQTKQLQQIQIQSTMHLKQRQVQQVQLQQQQQSGSAPSLPVDLHKSNSTPTLVTDHNGNHFLITLTNHITENQRSVAPESKTANQIALQRLHSTPAKLPSHNPVQLPKADNQANQSTHTGALTQQKTEPQNGRPQVCADQPQQDVSLCLSAPPSLQPFFTGQETTPSAKNTSSPSPQSELCTSLDVLFSPLSPASVKTTDSSPDNKDAEHEEDFIDIILQTGEMLNTFKPAPDPSLEHLNLKSSSPPPSQLQLFQPPSIPPCCDTLQSAPTVQSELHTLADTTGEKQHLVNAGSGRLEDFLESTTGKPLLGVEPGSLLTLIDDLHSQMLCTPSILDHPPSPMDTFDMAAEEEEEERGLDSMDWLDLTMGGGGVRGEETPTLTSLGPQTPPSVFSTDFLDSYDLQAHWDSCL